jgi:signal transduction histidine kinase
VGGIVGVDLACCGHPRSLGGPGRLAVENHGPPLSPEDDASFRVLTDPASKRGLGLYLLRLIAERYGASARAEDIADGVRFKVLLPLRSPRSRPSVRKSRSDAPVDPEPERP